MRSLRFERAGTTLTALVRDGAGTPLVVLPGVMADAESWLPVVEHITLPNPVIVINRRGRTPSGPLGPHYSVRTEIDDLHRILDDLGTDTHLFGWSYGGLIAVEAATERYDLRSLTLYEPVATPFAAEHVAPLRDATARGDLDRAVEIVNRDVSGFSAEYVENLRRTPVWPALVRLAAPLAEELAAVNDHSPALGRYPGLDLPVTLLVGELSEGRLPYGKPHAMFAGALPQAKVQRITGQGHLAHAQAPDLLGKQITDAVHC
ncbi:alpha/beta fold hydrolase [Actinophytocola algeriensis]|uniref:Pimeloyl-ACP methyl ester carboxylesterase n=1 Tax=Actinophytocola algeriensis TaxID=1768010 RepID=A0A7W7Q243_9PSEU|nr:alpha/beta hydrolase [Actinophytocola algeriensis]MBB4905630.1 pimeloyl-ACP methyl ester carboxylesterase [Actinophytocola algeriensis]MBE1472685.1 pimeloyl-ACP methyl ester carboxylesterase [Actinophytocola algeriensis]